MPPWAAGAGSAPGSAALVAPRPSTSVPRPASTGFSTAAAGSAAATGSVTAGAAGAGASACGAGLASGTTPIAASTASALPSPPAEGVSTALNTVSARTGLGSAAARTTVSAPQSFACSWCGAATLSGAALACGVTAAARTGALACCGTASVTRTGAVAEPTS
ncbi:hypothetical protein QWZ14_03785 [Paeniroseomonas aquatica]|uniref:Uncharacterized protein n=1 Tax=Paeniroseomonas aquatica TaxID=373043 RepID=A0ABT8A1C7_9PROT|nr:hypothetical protein [Paeniroseomonas aquatica]